MLRKLAIAAAVGLSLAAPSAATASGLRVVTGVKREAIVGSVAEADHMMDPSPHVVNTCWQVVERGDYARARIIPHTAHQALVTCAVGVTQRGDTEAWDPEYTLLKLGEYGWTEKLIWTTPPTCRRVIHAGIPERLFERFDFGSSCD